MSITEIVYLALIGLTLLFTVIPPICKLFSKKKTTESTSKVDTQTNLENGEESEPISTSEENSTTVVEDIFGKFKKIIDYVVSAEKLFSGISMGKTGSLKLADVLQKIKVDCLSNGEEYNETYYTDVVNKIVDVMNTKN